MARNGVLAALVALAFGGCGRDHGVARVRPLPKADPYPALRGASTPRSPRLANYKLDARLDVNRHQLAGTETLTWTNSGGSAVDTLPFHLYLNGFKNEASLLMRSSRGESRGVRASDTGWGWIQVDSLTLAGSELVSKLKYVGPDETVAELTLPQPVAPGATIELAFKFTAQLPEVFMRTGYEGEFHLVGQWFPKIGVRVGAPGVERWECQPFHANNEFFADFGTYDVALTVPSTYVVVGTGVLTGASDGPGGMRTLTYHAEDVHDFVWMADPYMEVMSGQAKLDDGPVEVRVYYRPEHKEFARRHLQAAIGAVEKFSAWFVPYPWSLLSVIDPPMDAAPGAGGMEYPTVVTTSGDGVFARPGLRLPEYVTVHEVGHNWFQGMLASNEPDEAWLDEGVNDWADGKVMDELYGARTSGVDWMGWQGEVAALRRAVAEDPASIPSPIATAAYAFVDSAAYVSASYETTSFALHTLEHTVGTSRFAAAMKAYAKAWVFRHPTGRDLFAMLGTELGEDLTWFFGPVFHSVGGLEVGIRSAECRIAHPPRGIFAEGAARKTFNDRDSPDNGFICEVVVTSTGTIHVPIDVDLVFADGSVERVPWDDRGTSTWKRIIRERAVPLTEVWIDPDNKLALDSPIKHHLRLDGDGSASLRAAAWVGSFAQTAMQLVGL